MKVCVQYAEERIHSRIQERNNKAYYFASIENLFNKEVVGWSLDTRTTHKLTISAMEQIY
jgi:hypothetical protein